MELSEIQQLMAAHPVEPYVRTLSRLADEAPDFVAITCADREITRGAWESGANRLARAYADLGVKARDFVAIALPNGIDFYVSFLAVLKLGAVPLPISYRLPEVERQTIVDLAGAALVVGVDPAVHPGHVCVGRDFVPDPALSDDALPELVSYAWRAITSGGSTGRPKIIVAGAPAEASPVVMGLLMQYGPDDVQAVVAPLYHNTSLSVSLSGLLLGQRLVVMERFDAEQLLAAVEEQRITWLSLVPTMLHRMNRVIEQGDRDYDLSSVRVMWHMASKCPEWLKEAWIERLGAEKIWELYGGTEMVSVTIITGPEWLEHRGSVGRPVMGDMRVLDVNGEEMPPGSVGEIFMRRAEGTPETFHYIGAEAKEQDGWTSLGDLGWKDEDGYLYISDRRVDMISPGGANVYPAEVENALDAHPKVISTVVVGVPDDDLGQRVHALVQAEPGTTAEELTAFLNDRLVRYKVPRSYEFIDHPLRDDSGKVRRSKMRDDAIERMQSSV
jgi:bile acid-coenzyme A ligase